MDCRRSQDTTSTMFKRVKHTVGMHFLFSILLILFFIILFLLLLWSSALLLRSRRLVVLLLVGYSFKDVNFSTSTTHMLPHTITTTKCLLLFIFSSSSSLLFYHICRHVYPMHHIFVRIFHLNLQLL